MTGVDTPAAVTPHLRRVRLASLDARERQAIIGRATTATPELRERVRATIEEVATAEMPHSGTSTHGSVVACGRGRTARTHPHPCNGSW